MAVLKKAASDPPLPPEYQKLVEQAEALGGMGLMLGFLANFGVGGEKISCLSDQVRDIRQQAEELSVLPSKFNQFFRPLGWLISESTNIESAKKAVSLAEAGKMDAAESALVEDYQKDKLDFLCRRLSGIEAFRNRAHIAREAAALCQEERYLAAIPLILIIADGVGQDYFGKAIFSEGIDLTELNAIAGHPGGLPSLTAEIAKSRKKFNATELSFPYRNGIIHGRDVNYGNRIVAAKAWSYLSCVGDVIRAKQAAKAADPEPELSLKESLNLYRETLIQKKMIEAWEPRPVFTPRWSLSSGSLDMFDAGAPEAALAAFLAAWKGKNYGKMGAATVYYDNRPIKKRAGEIRREMEQVILIDARIAKVKDEAAAITEINCQLTVKVNQATREEAFSFRMIYGDAHCDVLIRGHKDGTWKVLPSYQGWAIRLRAGRV